MTMHRRPLGRGRTMAAIGGALMVVGCVLPWWQVGGTPGIPAESGNGLAGAGSSSSSSASPPLALVALPYAAGDRPVGLDRWLSFALLAVAGWIGFALADRRTRAVRRVPVQAPRPRCFADGPGLWIAALGLVMLSRAAYTMTREPAYR